MQPIEVENIDVAIIGGGPSGLSAAITLRKLGVGTVVETSVNGAGVILSAAGKVLAFIPNEIGKTLMHNERL